MKLDPATYETWEPGDLRPALPHIASPTLVLRGAESIVTSTEGLLALANGLPSREVREIKSGSHMLLLDGRKCASHRGHTLVEVLYLPAGHERVEVHPHKGDGHRNRDGRPSVR